MHPTMNTRPSLHLYLLRLWSGLAAAAAAAAQRIAVTAALAVPVRKEGVSTLCGSYADGVASCAVAICSDTADGSNS